VRDTSALASKRFQCARLQAVSPEVSHESDVKELRNRETKWHATPGDREDHRQAALGLHPVSRCPTWLSGQEGHGNCNHRSQAASAADSDATTGAVRDLCGSAQGLRRHGSGESPGDTAAVWSWTTHSQAPTELLAHWHGATMDGLHVRVDVAATSFRRAAG